MDASHTTTQSPAQPIPVRSTPVPISGAMGARLSSSLGAGPADVSSLGSGYSHHHHHHHHHLDRRHADSGRIDASSLSSSAETPPCGASPLGPASPASTPTTAFAARGRHRASSFAPGSYPGSTVYTASAPSVSRSLGPAFAAAGVAAGATAGAATGEGRPRAYTMSAAKATELKMREAGVYNTFDIAGAAAAQPSSTSVGSAAEPIVGDAAAPGVQAPLAVKIVGFNREPSGRPRYTIEVRFERQRWTIFKYYTDFYKLRNTLEGSQFIGLAENLPRKHPLRLKLRMKLALTKRRAQRAEIPFVLRRMQMLEDWLNRLLEHIGPAGLDHVKFLDSFFNAFPEDEPYNQNEPREPKVDVSKSMYHVLKAIGVPIDVYYRLWNHGHSVESIATLSRQQWMAFGASAVLSCELYRNLFRPEYLLQLAGVQSSVPAPAARRSTAITIAAAAPAPAIAAGSVVPTVISDDATGIVASSLSSSSSSSLQPPRPSAPMMIADQHKSMETAAVDGLGATPPPYTATAAMYPAASHATIAAAAKDAGGSSSSSSGGSQCERRVDAAGMPSAAPGGRLARRLSQAAPTATLPRRPSRVAA